MPILGIYAAANQSAIATANSYESIATVTVGAGESSSISFTSIPSTYKHLQLRIFAKETNNTTPSFDAIDVTFNSDAAANYSWHRLQGNGSSASADSGTSTNYLLGGVMRYGASSELIMDATIIDILEYANTNIYKTTRSLTGVDANGSGSLGLWSGSWRSTSAINRIDLYPDNRSKTFSQYSSFALFGIKGA